MYKHTSDYSIHLATLLDTIQGLRPIGQVVKWVWNELGVNHNWFPCFCFVFWPGILDLIFGLGGNGIRCCHPFRLSYHLGGRETPHFRGNVCVRVTGNWHNVQYVFKVPENTSWCMIYNNKVNQLGLSRSFYCHCTNVNANVLELQSTQENSMIS